MHYQSTDDALLGIALLRTVLFFVLKLFMLNKMGLLKLICFFLQCFAHRHVKLAWK